MYNMFLVSQEQISNFKEFSPWGKRGNVAFSPASDESQKEGGVKQEGPTENPSDLPNHQTNRNS